MVKSMRIKWARHVARLAEMGHVCNILVGKPEGKRVLEEI
jgi:hypothetical protein